MRAKQLPRTGRLSDKTVTCRFVLKLILMFESLMQLTHSEALFPPYLLVYALGMLAAVCLYKREIRLGRSLELPHRERKLGNAAAVLFTLLVGAGNYPLWLEYSLGASTPAVLRAAYGFVMFAFICGGCFFAFHSIFRYIALYPGSLVWRESDDSGIGAWNPKKLFYLSFFLIAFVYLFVLFLIKYPGLVEADTIVQFYECLTGDYSNKNPLFSTLAIKPFVALGMALFNDIKACAAMYFTAQSLFVAFVFACVVKNLAQMKVPVWFLLCTVFFYAFMPYHIMFSIGHSKDVLFSVSITLFCLVLFRVLKNPDVPKKYYFYLFIVSIGFCMMRSNGILAFAFFVPVYWACYKKGNKRILMVLLLAVLVCVLVKRPLFNALQIPQSDVFESLSLPTQQIARAVIEHNDLTQAEFDVLNPIMNVSMIPQKYNPGISDPIKALIRATTKGNPVSKQQLMEFVKVWFELGLRHPVSYAKAFVDITCGYWNAGYSAAPWCNFIYENDLGLYLTNPNPILNMLYDRYIGAFNDFSIFQIMICTGLFVWAYLISGFVCLIRKDKMGAVLCVPVLCVVQTLILGVPVGCDLRYIYCAFCGLPFVAAIATRPGIEESSVTEGAIVRDKGSVR